MKKIMTIIIAVLLAVSCKDMLEETVYSSLTDDNAFTSGENALSSVNSIYAPLHSLYREPMFYLNDVTADSGYKGGSPFEVLNDEGIYNDERTLNAWNYLYQIATRANIAIDRIPGMAANNFTNISRERLLGEACFMRAFAYYNLTDLFFQVPLILDSKISPSAKEKYDKIDKIEMQIEDDLLKAKEWLPKSYAAREDAGRPTYGAACGYLARLYMRQAGRERTAGGEADALPMWRDALFEVNNVLALEGSIYSLQPTVWEVFDPSSEATLYNNELIFAIRASDKTLANGSWDLGLQFTPWGYDMGWSNILQQLEMTWCFDPDDDRFKVLQVTRFPDVYNGTNAKKTYSLAPPSIDKTGAVIPADHVIDGNRFDEIVELDATFTQKYKYLYTRQYNYNTPNNLPLLRLADIILCKAEILNELNGPNQESISLVNRIRERAYHGKSRNLTLAEFPDKATLRNAICDERLFELNMECLRRPDLIRMGLWKDRMQRLLYAIDKKYEWKEKNEGRASGYYNGSWASYPDPLSLSDDDPRQYIPIPYREVLMNGDLANARKGIETAATPDVMEYSDPVHYGEGEEDEPDDPDTPGEEVFTTKWDFDTLDGWVYSPQGGTPESQCHLEDGCLVITSRKNTQDRPKYRTSGGRIYGPGKYVWRIFIPEIEAGAQASVGAFLYMDDAHELDFEIGYGTAAARTQAGAKEGEMVACMTNQQHPTVSRYYPVTPGWHTFTLDMPLSGDYYNAVWYIDDVQKQSQRLNFGAETQFYIYVSVENLIFMGDHLPTRDVSAKFDYVAYKKY